MDFKLGIRKRGYPTKKLNPNNTWLKKKEKDQVCWETTNYR
jgi:hypothetical protein